MGKISTRPAPIGRDFHVSYAPRSGPEISYFPSRWALAIAWLYFLPSSVPSQRNFSAVLALSNQLAGLTFFFSKIFKILLDTGPSANAKFSIELYFSITALASPPVTQRAKSLAEFGCRAPFRTRYITFRLGVRSSKNDASIGALGSFAFCSI